MRTPIHRRTVALAALFAAACLGLTAAPALAVSAAVAPAPAVTVPITPPSEELHAGADSSITIDWVASPGATSYNIYRSTAAGAEGNTPYVSGITGTTYVDKNLSPTPTYFYEISAVNSAGESGRTAEDASKTPPPMSTGGTTPGVANGNSLIFYGENARLAGFDWFQTLTGWFPQVLGSSGSNSPNKQVVDMAYASAGSMTFNDVVVPTAGLYNIDWRYAFQGGLFPAVNNRQMGLEVNGVVLTSTERFPITGSFDVYQDSVLQAHLNAGTNSVALLAVSSHGVSRVDQLIVSPAAASVPAGPTNLAVTPSNTSASLSWTASSSGNPTSYTIYRGTASDGEAVTPVGTVSGTTTTFTDNGLTNGKTYFYNVAAHNAVGVSPDSNEVTVVPGGTVTIPAPPGNLTATPGDTTASLSWNASSGASSYSIYRGTAAGGEGATAIATTTGTTYTDTGLTNGTTYYYTAKASNSAGTSGASNEAHAMPAASTMVPPPPTGLTATAGNALVSLAWNPSSGATGYSIYRGTAAGGEGATAIATTAGTAYTDTSVTNGTTYYYTVKATNSAGPSGASNEAHAAPAAGGGNPPGVPFGVVITPQTGDILLQWGFESAATSYNVYRGTTPGGEGSTPLATVTSPTYIDHNVVSGTTYYYQFTAVDAGGESARTAEFSATAK